MKIILAIFFLLGAALSQKVRYDGFEVHRVTPKTEAQVLALRTLEENIAYNFWSDITGVNNSVNIMVPPNLKTEFLAFAEDQLLEEELIIENVQDRIDNERSAGPQPRSFGWTDYHRLNVIYEWLDQLAATYPTVTRIVGGHSYEGRQIRGVRVSFSPNNVNNAVFIECGIHAREWIAPATCTFMLDQILTSNNSTLLRYDWYVFPVFNPDGCDVVTIKMIKSNQIHSACNINQNFDGARVARVDFELYPIQYKKIEDRLWRKTRTPYGTCFGADPNRNWGYQWSNGGTSSNPCSLTYAGPHPFSESSTRSMSQYISTIQDRLVAYIDFHSSGQLLLIPYGHTADELDNYQELYTVGVKAMESLAVRYGTQFRVGNIVSILYVASGSSMDWVKGTYGTRITYAYELRDTGTHGFLLPPEQIIPSGWETLDSLIRMLDEFDNL